MDRVFLDANVLFSAAYRESAGLLRLWRLGNTELLTSVYSAEEARRNLDNSDARSRLEDLLGDVTLVPESAEPLPRGVRLTEKDEPILRSALAANATHLLTGDVRDFGRLLGKRVGGVMVQLPGDYLREREGRHGRGPRTHSTGRPTG
jgi:predicted nucleic acid-binding protein